MPAAARFHSAPVCLPSCTAERRAPSGGRSKRGASRETESSGAFMGYCQTRALFIIFHSVACLYGDVLSQTLFVNTL